MVSLAEKMAANMDMSAFSKAEELKKRLWFTVLALIVFRLGTFIPLPGIDPHILSDIFARQSSGILGMFNMFSGGALERMTIFALNIMPYISASTVGYSVAGSTEKGRRGRPSQNYALYQDFDGLYYDYPRLRHCRRFGRYDRQRRFVGRGYARFHL